MAGGALPDQRGVLGHDGVHEFQGLREKILMVDLAGNGQPEPQVMAENPFQDSGKVGVFGEAEDKMVKIKVKINYILVAGFGIKGKDLLF